MELSRNSFKSIEELAKWADDGHLSRNDLQVIYDGIPGAPPQKRLRNRPCAIERIWAERGKLPEGIKPKPARAETSDRGALKARIIEMLRGGATMDELLAATGWQRHSLRGYISTLNKAKTVHAELVKGEDGVKRYRSAAA